MKKFLMLANLVTVFSLQAAEVGNYLNLGYRTEDPTMFKSVTLSSEKCNEGGFIVKFNAAQEMNFCAGNFERRDSKIKKCIGKELSYPFGGCVGVTKTMTLSNIVEVTVDEASGVITRAEKSLLDEEITFEQEYVLIPSKGKLTVVKSFQDHTDGRVGEVEYTFVRK